MGTARRLQVARGSLRWSCCHLHARQDLPEDLVALVQVLLRPVPQRHKELRCVDPAALTRHGEDALWVWRQDGVWDRRGHQLTAFPQGFGDGGDGGRRV